MFNRRDFLITSMVAGTILAMPVASKPAKRRFDAAERLQMLEVGQARLGVCFLDTVTGEVSGNRIEERFAMCSSFKLAIPSAMVPVALPFGILRLKTKFHPNGITMHLAFSAWPIRVPTPTVPSSLSLLHQLHG